MPLASDGKSFEAAEIASSGGEAQGMAMPVEVKAWSLELRLWPLSSEQ